MYALPSESDIPVSFASAPLTARGAETHIVANVDELELYIDYNYADVRRRLNNRNEILPFTPRHKLNFTLTYEEEGNWRTGVEAFYTDRQFKQNGEEGRAYFIMGLMFEKKFKYFSLIFNIENLLDERQSRYEKMVRLVNGSPRFEDVYMPLEGRIANLVLWMKL